MSEGAAISKKNMRIAFSQTRGQIPELPQGASRIIMADIDLSGGTPKLSTTKPFMKVRTGAVRWKHRISMTMTASSPMSAMNQITWLKYSALI